MKHIVTTPPFSRTVLYPFTKPVAYGSTQLPLVLGLELPVLSLSFLFVFVVLLLLIYSNSSSTLFSPLVTHVSSMSRGCQFLQTLLFCNCQQQSFYSYYHPQNFLVPHTHWSLGKEKSSRTEHDTNTKLPKVPISSFPFQICIKNLLYFIDYFRYLTQLFSRFIDCISLNFYFSFSL